MKTKIWGGLMGVKFSGVKACVFDAYGTLFDVHAPVGRVASKIGPNADDVSKLWRQKQLEYTWLRSLMGAHAPFWQITTESLDYALAFFNISDEALREELRELYFKLDAYEDARDCLGRLKEAGFTTAILSNGSPDMLEGAVSSSGLDKVLDHVISVEDVGIYKPDSRVYQLAVERTDVSAPSEICFVSANPWDAQAGAHFGYQVARINRFGLADDNIPGKPATLLSSLSELPDIVN
ncbi:MAG: haloacid dehalogenase type II [Hyphomicrobiales bacterium]